MAETPPRDATASLYLHSLYYLPMLDDLGATPAIEALLSGYVTFSESDHFARLPVGNRSWDHATAMRLKALSLLAARDERHAWALDSALFAKDLAWACSPENIKPNNHGLTLVGTLLCVARVLQDRGDPRETTARSVALAGLRRVLEHVFGHDGYCAENSPYYSGLYVRLLKVIRDNHREELADGGVQDLVADTLASAETTTAVQVFPEGGYVPRGDTGRSSSPFRPPRGTFSSERVGLWVHHGRSLYVMATSGSAALTHKHRDDMQVLLRYQGQDFFVDAGYAGYGRQDPRVRALRRATGHSCLAFAEVDEPGQLFNRVRHEGWATTRPSRRRGDVPAVRLTQGLEGHFDAERFVEVLGEHTLRLTDSWDSPRGWRPVQRFLVPIEAAIDVRRRGIHVTVDGRELDMSYEAPIHVTVTSAQAQAPYKGWRAVDARTMEPCHCVEVTPAAGGRSMRTTLRLSAEGV